MTLPETLEPARAGALPPTAAIIGGILVLAVGVVVSFGLVLGGCLGIWVVLRMLRARGRFLSRGRRWLAASASVAILGLVAFALGAAVVSSSGKSQFRKTYDSAAAASANRPPPAWLERIAPGASGRKRATPTSPLIGTFAMIWGMGFSLVLMSAIYGSFAWAAVMLVGFGIRGHWPGP